MKRMSNKQRRAMFAKIKVGRNKNMGFIEVDASNNPRFSHIFEGTRKILHIPPKKGKFIEKNTLYRVDYIDAHGSAKKPKVYKTKEGAIKSAKKFVSEVTDAELKDKTTQTYKIKSGGRTMYIDSGSGTFPWKF